MIWVLAVHLLFAAALPAAGRRMGRRVLLVATMAPLVALAHVVAVAPSVLAGEQVASEHRWVPGLDLSVRLAMDGMTLLMVTVIAAVGVLILLYSHGYVHDERGAGKLAALLVGFAGSMLGLVMADDLLMLYVFWELTSVTSYLLIGLEDQRAQARSSALQALLVTGLGGLVMLAGLVLVAQAAGTTSLSGVLADPPTGTTVSVGVGLVLVGAFTKSAQVPFHFWLPGAMAAPTPVSAYLHSATMVKAGVYLIARFAPVFAPLLGYWRPLVVGVGAATMILGGWRALRQTDMKLLLAYGTVSQLGFLVVLFGTGDPELVLAGALVLVAHTLFKATLFLVTGIVDHELHTRDLRRLHRVGRRMPGVATTASIAAASMAGVPLLAGFVAKEEALSGFLAWSDPLSTTALVAVVVGSALTAAYGLRFVVGGFFSPGEGQEAETSDRRRITPFLFVPVALLTAGSLLAGLWPALLDGWSRAVLEALVPGSPAPHLAVWHGFDPALGLSVLALASGWALWRFPAAWRAAARATSLIPSATHLYNRALVGLNRIAKLTTSIAQNGSLPIYIGVILVTTIALTGVPLARAWTAPPALRWASHPVQALVGILVVAAAIGATRARRRLTAVLALGTVGYGVAVLMVVQGAPDVALTQMLVETMVVVIFVLVLRRLPIAFERVRWRAREATRVAVSVSVGLLAAAFTWSLAGADPDRRIAEEMTQLALPEGGGRNVVNVILTDFRALDTMGEITVVAVAAMGVLALIRAGRADRDQGGGEE